MYLWLVLTFGIMGIGDVIRDASDLIVQAGVVSAFFVYYLFKLDLPFSSHHHTFLLFVDI